MKLSARQIQRLKILKSKGEHGSLSFDQFRNAISAPFTSQTLLNAMRGQEVNPSTYHFLIGVLNRHAPEKPQTDGKSMAAGAQAGAEGDETSETPETPSEGENTPEAERTRRGSR